MLLGSFLAQATHFHVSAVPGINRSQVVHYIVVRVTLGMSYGSPPLHLRSSG